MMSNAHAQQQKKTSALLKVLLTSLTNKSADGKPLLSALDFESLLEDLLSSLKKEDTMPQPSVMMGMAVCAKILVTKNRTETLSKLWMRLALHIISKDHNLKTGRLQEPQTEQQLLTVLMSGCLDEIGLGASNSTSTENLVIAIRLLVTCLRSLGTLGITNHSPAALSAILQGLLGKHSKKESVLQASCEALQFYWAYLSTELSLELKHIFGTLKKQRMLKAREDSLQSSKLFASVQLKKPQSQVQRQEPLTNSLSAILDKTFEAFYLLSAPLAPNRQGFHLLPNLSPRGVSHYVKLFSNLRMLLLAFDPSHPLLSSLLPDLIFLSCSLADVEDSSGTLVDSPSICSLVRPALQSLADAPVSTSDLRKNLSLCRTAARHLTPESKRELLSWSLACNMFKPVLPQTVQLGSVQVFGTGGVSELLSWTDLQAIVSADLSNSDVSELLARKLGQTPGILLRDFLPQFMFETQQIAHVVDKVLLAFTGDSGPEFFQTATAHIEDFISFVVSVYRSETQVSVAELSTRPSQVDEPLLELCSVLFITQALASSTSQISEVFLQAAESCIKDLVCWGLRSYLEASNLIFSSRGKTLYSLVTNLGLVALNKIICRRVTEFPQTCQHTWVNNVVYNLLSIEEIDGTTAANLTACLCSIVSALKVNSLTESSSLKGFLAANQTELIETAKFQLLNSPGSKAASSSLSLLAYLAKFALTDPDPRLPRALLPLVSTVVDSLPVKPAPGVNHSILVLFGRLLDVLKSCKNPAFIQEEEEKIANPSPSRLPIANLVRRIALRVMPWLNRHASSDRQSLVIETLGKLSETLKDLPQMTEGADESLSAHEPAHCTIPSAAEPLIVELWTIITTHLLGIARGVVQSDDPRSKAMLDLINASSQTRVNWCKGKLTTAFDEQEQGEDILFNAALTTRTKLTGKLQGAKVDRVLLLPTLELLRDIGRLHPTILMIEDRAETLTPLLCVSVLYFKPSDLVWVPHLKEAICAAELIQKMFPSSLRTQIRPLIDLLAYRTKNLKSQSPYLDRLRELVNSDTKA